MFSQERLDTLYVIFDQKNGDRKIIDNDEIHFVLKADDWFKINSRHRLTFLHKENDQKYNPKKGLDLSSGLEAVEKVNSYLNAMSLECEKLNKKKNRKHCLIIKNPPAYYYNNYFKKIFIYEKLNETEGMLYEVKWNWSIE